MIRTIEKCASNGDDADKVKTQQVDDREQEGNAEQDGGGRGAQPPSAPTPLEVFFAPESSDELSIWSPKSHAASTTCFTFLLYLREDHMRKHGRAEMRGG